VDEASTGEVPAPDPHDGVPQERQEGLERLRDERDELLARLAVLERTAAGRGRAWPRARRGIVAVLVVVGIACSTAATAGWWVRRNVADTDRWVERVGTLPDDPAVQAAIGDWLGDRVVELVDPRALFVEVLPERGRLLAVPLAGAVEEFLRERVDTFVASERFADLWVAANERAHQAAVRVLRGESDVVEARGDRVVIDLVPAIDAVLAEIGEASPTLLGREVDLPDVRVDDVPDVAVERLEAALGVTLPDDFGRFVVYDHGRLGALQDGLERARRWLVVVSVGAVASSGAALALSRHRRRTLLQLLGGLAFGLALIRRVGLRSQREVLATIDDPGARDAARAVTDRFLDPLLASTRTLLVVLAVLAVIVVVTGPYPWAVRLRRATAGLPHRLRPGAAAATAVARLRDHAGALRVGGLVAVVALLLVVDLSFAGLLALGAVVGLGAAALRPPPSRPSGG
jgi:hypothetical protein